VAASRNWLALFDEQISWQPWEFRARVDPTSVWSIAIRGSVPDSATLLAAIKQFAEGRLATDSIILGADTTNRVHVAMAASFGQSAAVLLLSSSSADIHTSDLSDPALLSMISAAPPLTNFVARFPVASLNSILAGQPNQVVTIPQSGGNSVHVSNLRFAASPGAVHISGDYHSAQYDAKVDTDWQGSDLQLQTITVTPVLETCQPADFDCISRNAVRNAGASAASTAYTVQNTGKPLRPTNPGEKHTVEIATKTLNLIVHIARAAADSGQLMFFGGAALSK
jgi:hypothetical protein